MARFEAANTCEQRQSPVRQPHITGTVQWSKMHSHCTPVLNTQMSDTWFE